MLHAEDARVATPGRTMAPKAEIIRMAHEVIVDTPLVLRVVLRSGTTDTWRRASAKETLYELIESVPSGGRS